MTFARGLGLAPLGVAPYGLGAPIEAPETTSAPPFLDEAGVVQTGRLIDPDTRQYVIDAQGRTVGMQTVRQLVQLAVSTRLGSSVLPDLGEGLTAIEDITDSFERRVDTVLREAVSRLVRDRLIEVLDVTTERIGTSGARARMRWRDLSSEVEQQTLIG